MDPKLGTEHYYKTKELSCAQKIKKEAQNKQYGYLYR